MIEDLTPVEVADRMRSDSPPVLVDVREDWERSIAAIPDAVGIPMAEIPSRLHELPSGRDIVLFCHHGMRSLQVAHWLQTQGFDRLVNLTGGIDAWSHDVDPTIPTY